MAVVTARCGRYRPGSPSTQGCGAGREPGRSLADVGERLNERVAEKGTDRHASRELHARLHRDVARRQRPLAVVGAALLHVVACLGLRLLSKGVDARSRAVPVGGQTRGD
eukprot:211822-Chlamydomonas_euryale.AAC.1